MQYKLVAMDIDGTLTNSDGKIPDDNKRVIKHLNDKGVKFVIATGRNDVEAVKLANELEIEPLIIGCNGATVRNLSTNVTYVYKYINDTALEKLFSIAYANKLAMRLASLEYLYLAYPEFDILDTHRTKKSSTYERTMIDENVYNTIDDYKQLSTYKDKIIKSVVINNHEKVLDFQAATNKIPGLTGFRSSLNCLDIVNEHASKGSALKELADKLGIMQSEVIAIGDGENDIPMLEYAGMAVAMGNGEEAVKKVAGFVTKTNNEAGLAYAMGEIFCLDKALMQGLL